MAVDGNGECAGATRFRATPTGCMEPGGKLYTLTMHPRVNTYYCIDL